MEPRPDHGEKSYRGSGRLAGRKALITGGDSGMGRAAAIAYAREGADVAINYFPSEEPDAQEVIALIKAEGRKGLAIQGDLRTKILQNCRRAREGLGGLDIIVNNAARQQSRESILDVSSDDFDATMKTNIYAPFWIIKAALPHLKPGAVIIGTSSEQAYDPSPELYDYAQTKAATMNYVKSLAKQLGPKGIRVNAVAPGQSGLPCKSRAARRLRSWKSSAAIRRSGVPANPLNWPLSTCSWQPATQVMQTVRSTARPAAPASPESYFGSGSTNPAAGLSRRPRRANRTALSSARVCEVDENGRPTLGLCFLPMGDLPIGDVMLSQKIALENSESRALGVARRFAPGGTFRRGRLLRWDCLAITIRGRCGR